MMKIVAFVVVVGFAVVLANEHKTKNEKPAEAGAGAGNNTSAEHGARGHGHGKPAGLNSVSVCGRMCN